MRLLLGIFAVGTGLALALGTAGPDLQGVAFRAVKAVPSRPGYPLPVNGLDAQGIRSLAQARYEEAADSFTRSLRLVPGNPGALANRGTAFLALDRLEEAMSDYALALELEPGLGRVLAHPLSRAHVRRAQRRMDEGETRGAEEDLRAALRYDPDFGPAYSELSVLAFKGKDTAGCLDLAERALALEGSVPEALANKAACLAWSGRLREALAELERAAALEPGRAELHASMAGVLSRMGEAGPAREKAVKAVELEPRLREALAPILYSRTASIRPPGATR